MAMNDLILVSVDDHVVEPPDIFAQALPIQYKARAPRVIQNKKGDDIWTFEGRMLPNIGLNAVAGRVPEEYGMEPTSYRQMRKGCYDVHARIDDMNVNGVLGSMCFSSFPGLCGRLWAQAQDKDLAAAVSQAYNDWHVDEWCAAYPGRFLPLGMIPMWDPKLAAEEVRRLARKGCYAISLSENPVSMKVPSYHDDAYWDPIWQACVDEGVAVCIHIGTGTGIPTPSMDTPIDSSILATPMTIATCAADLLFSKALRRWPTLTFVLSEGGTGWVPYFLDRADYVYEHHHQWTGQHFGALKPSDVFRRQIVSCFFEDPVGVELRHRIGIDMITWECDYPHSDSTWPEAPERLWPVLRDLPQLDVDKMTHANAMRIFRYDPFATIPRELCTVGALRAQAKHVDLTPIRGVGGRPPGVGAGEVVRMAQIVKQLAGAMDG
ncbi:MAG: amidohydrolase family protein [Proteobacteria bacterium]|nr:amidohydrolase family protein [Pseudomonadota bacterium]